MRGDLQRQQRSCRAPEGSNAVFRATKLRCKFAVPQEVAGFEVSEAGLRGPERLAEAGPKQGGEGRRGFAFRLGSGTYAC